MRHYKVFRNLFLVSIAGCTLALTPSWSAHDVGVSISAETIQSLTQEIINHPDFKNALPLDGFETAKPTLKLAGAPELVKDYGKYLFNLNFEKDFNLHLKIFSPSLSYNVVIQNVQFLTQDGQTRLRLQIALSKLKIRLSKVWLRELGFTNGKPLGPDACRNTPTRSQFFKDHIFVALEGLELSPRDDEKSEILIHTEILAKIDPKDKKLLLDTSSIQTNLGSAAKSLYRLKVGKLVLPEIDFKVNGKCFPADLKPLEDYFRANLKQVKDDLVSSVATAITQSGTKALKKALRNLSVPTEFAFKEFPADSKDARDLIEAQEYSVRMAQEHAEQNVLKSSPYYQEPLASDNTHVALNVPQGQPKIRSLFKDWYDSFLSFELKTQVSQIQSLDEKHLFLGLSDQMVVNSKKEQSSSVGIAMGQVYKTAMSSETAIVISKKWIEEKLSIAFMLKLIEREIPITGISFTGKGLVLHPETDGGLSLTALAFIDLNAVPGFWASVGAGVERTFGGTYGRVHLPIHFTLKPTLNAKEHHIQIKIARNFDKTKFNEESNLKDLAGLLRYFSVKKLNEFADKLEAEKFDLPIADIITSTGTRPTSMRFDSDGNLAIGLRMVDLNERIIKMIDSDKEQAK